MKIHNLGTDRPYLALPDPFSRYKLTLLEEEDLPTITSILSNEPISQYLNTVPELYTLDDAKYWYNLQPSNANIRNLRESTGTKEEQEEQKQVLMSRFPFSVIRDSESGLLVGYFSIRRNEWEWMEGFDPSGRASLRQANDRRKDGDEAISYSIGKRDVLLLIRNTPSLTCITSIRLLHVSGRLFQRPNDSRHERRFIVRKRAHER